MNYSLFVLLFISGQDLFDWQYVLWGWTR